MKRPELFRGVGVVAFLGLSAAMILNVRGQQPPAPVPAPPQKPGEARADLGGADRFLTYVSTDKPMYRPGEKVYVRAVVLHGEKHTPLPGGAMPALAEVTGPKGDVVASGPLTTENSVAGFQWDIPKEMPGGEYTVKVSHPYSGYVPGARKFDIRAYRAPRLKSQIVFVRDGYGPGDTVAASVHTERAEGGIPAGAKVTAIARVDGAEVFRGETKVDEKGNASTSFPLPAAIARGEGSLAFVIEDGGVLETASKTIPILLQTVDLTMYPEGGDLVAGVPNRVYIEAFTPAKKPADLFGVIVDGKGADVVSFATAHEGRGRFEFTPKKGEAYTLKIRQPAGIKTTYPLPAVREQGVVISAERDVTAKGQPVQLAIGASVPGAYKVVVAKRERELGSAVVNVAAEVTEKSPAGSIGVGQLAHVSVALPEGADGVLVATVWNEQTKLPVAERLVFRQPSKAVKIEVKADKESYVPAEGVKLTVTTTDDSGKPVGAVVGLTVTDDAVLEMIEKREQAPRLPVMVLLESDVKELADAHVYLDEANPKAPQAVDLLLGTQGWRRFAFHKTADFIAKNGDDARRVLALRVVTRTEMEDAMRMPRGGAAWADGGVAVAGAMPHAAGVPGEARGLGAPKGPVPANGPAVRDDAKAPVAGEPGVPADAKEKAAERPAKDQAKNDPAAGPAAAAAPPVVAGGAQPAASLRPAVQADAELAKKLEEAQAGQADRRQIMGKRAAAREMADMIAARNDFVLVREYAHAVRPGRRAGDRVDFAETLYWNAGVKTDDKTGQATVALALSDAVTSFRVFAEGFSPAGALGQATAAIKSVQPFYAEAKLPLEITQGDRVQVPLTLVNGTPGRLEGATFTLPQIKSATDFSFANKPMTMNPGDRLRKLLGFTAGDATGEFDFAITASAGEFADKLTRKLKVKPRGFPIEFAKGGLLGPDGSVTYEVEIPADVVANSVTSDVAVYPTPLANLTQALEALIQSPCGCFEQTSSTTYPLVMAQQYFTSHQGVDPKLIERSRQLLAEGYQRLMGFECKTTKGFEWFGADPGHDALSAYGLLEFTDMAIVREVDTRMLNDTRAFVMKSRDGKGGYKRQTHTLHTWISDPECANGYNTWALLECKADPKELAAEVGWIKENVAKSANSYALALAANIMALAGDKDAAKAFMDKLAARQTKDGLVDGATTSVIGSGGEALQIETTALATLAWLRDPAYAGNVEKSMKWLAETCKAGRFGSTQSTILALRAIVTYDKMRATPKAPGTVQVIVDGKPMGSAVAFDAKTQGAIKLQDVSEMMSPGKHTIVLKMAGGSQMPFSLAVKYNTLKPNSSEQCKVTLATSLRDKKVGEGALTEAVVNVANRDEKPVPTPIAIVGIPGGLEVRHDQLKELVKSGKIDSYEVIGREVVLYWRSLAGGQKVEVPLSLTAAIPGTYTGPASRAYLYYTDEHKAWTDPLAVEVTPKE